MLLAILLSFTHAAFADDGIQQVEEGSTVTPPSGEVWAVGEHSYLLPEPYYNQALVKARQLDIYRPALEQCLDLGSQWAGQTQAALLAVSELADSDTALTNDLVAQIAAMESRALTAEAQVGSLKMQRTVAWAITGGLIVGAVTVTSLSLN
tara:strand:+ start:2021 stop:2473 length:453 start_codon:yes stop_codon:yes gene_type:complete